MTIRRRKRRRRRAVGNHADEARLHFRAMTIYVTANQEVGWRGLIAARALKKIAAFNGGTLNTLARSRLVARAVRRKPVVAIGDAFGRRYRRRPLFFQFANLGVEFFAG